MGWNCIDDDISLMDQCCDLVNLKNLICDFELDNILRMEMVEFVWWFGNEVVRRKFWCIICKFLSEWDKVIIFNCYVFVQKFDVFRINLDVWLKLEVYFNVISFGGFFDVYKSVDWWFYLLEFVKYFRKCGWLSLNELVQLLLRVGVKDCVKDWNLVRDWLVDIVGYIDFNCVF